MWKRQTFVHELRTDESDKWFVGFSFIEKRCTFGLKFRVGFWKVISRSEK